MRRQKDCGTWSGAGWVLCGDLWGTGVRVAGSRGHEEPTVAAAAGCGGDERMRGLGVWGDRCCWMGVVPGLGGGGPGPNQRP